MELVIHTAETAPDGARQVLDGIAGDLGFVPNLAGTAAGSAALVGGFDALRRAAGSTGIDPVDREIAGLAVGVHAGNAYGVAFHSTVLARLGVGEHDLTAMRAGSPPAEARHAAVYGFAREVTVQRGAVGDKPVRLLREAGYTDEHVLDLL